ncbi:MAG: hypothetical protein ACI4VQ_03060 [Clostridia bacterium]
MNTNMKDKLKMSIALGVLLIIIMVVLIIVIQYQIEGEKNMPYKLSKITIISTAEGEQNTNSDENLKWNLSVNQSNDIYFFIDKTSSKDEIIDSVTISNVQITREPSKGKIKVFMPNSTEGRTFVYKDEYIIEDKLEYKGGKSTNPQTLEIGNQGGYALIRFANTGIGEFTLDEDTIIKHDGTLIPKVGANEEEIKFEVNFDLTIQVNEIKYRANITLNLPCDNVCEAGTTTQEITDISNIVFKRVK